MQIEQQIATQWQGGPVLRFTIIGAAIGLLAMAATLAVLGMPGGGVFDLFAMAGSAIGGAVGLIVGVVYDRR